MIRAKKVVAEHIQAKTVDIEDELHVGRILTRQCDVAYHFLLKDDREVFQEGKRLWILRTILCYHFPCFGNLVSHYQYRHFHVQS